MARGYSDCGCSDKVFGFSSDVAQMVSIVDGGGGADDPRVNEYFVGTTVGSSDWHDGATWPLIGTKVPSSFPYGSCDTDPPMSTADPRSDEQWQAGIGLAASVSYTTEDDVTTQKIRDIHFVMCSRAICIDDEQAFAVWGVTANPHGDVPEEPHGGSLLNRNDVNTDNHYDHHQVNLDTQVAVQQTVEQLGQTRGFFSTASLQQKLFCSNPVQLSPIPDCGLPFHNPSEAFWQHACNCTYYGKEFYFVSTYSPAVEPGVGWMNARLEYASIPDVLNSDASVGEIVAGDAVCTGPYAIMLPSKDAWLLSDAEDLPDEPWTIARSITGDPKVVTGISRDTTTRAFSGDVVWDGTLAESEVKNVIIPPASGPYMDDDFTDPRVHSYIHMNGKDLAIITCKPVSGPDDTVTPTADFGEDGVAGDLNHGLPSSPQFENPLEELSGGQWTVENNAYYTDPGSYGDIDETKYAVQAHIGPSFVAQVDLLRKTVQVVNAGSSISFKYRLDNRAQSAVFPYSFTGNFPGDDGFGNHDTLEFYIDGALVWSEDNTLRPAVAATFLEFDTATVTGITAGPHDFRWTLRRVTSLNNMTAWLDDIDFPEELATDSIDGRVRYIWDGERLRKAKFWAWPLRDNEQNTSITSRVSTVPESIVFDRTRGNEGKILYGNPHYLVRVIVDGIDNDANPDGVLDTTFAEKGIKRFTASPALGIGGDAPIQVQNANCDWIDVYPPVDSVADPKWGSYQIQPMRNRIDLRGVNGSLDRDATVDPIGRVLYDNEEFVNVTNVGAWFWNNRVSGWTLKDDGHTCIPHIEVLWRPTIDQPAFPVTPPYDNPDDAPGPWPAGMEDDSPKLADNVGTNFTAGNTLLATPDFCRIRDQRSFLGPPRPDTAGPHIVSSNTLKPVFNKLNRVWPRIYGDSFSRRPQFVWARKRLEGLNVDPLTGDDAGYLNPPWPSVQWKLIIARHNPSAGGEGGGTTIAGRSAAPCGNCSTNPTATNFIEGCDLGDFHYTWSVFEIGMSGFTDFVAVDCDCDCGCLDPIAPPSYPVINDLGYVEKLFTFSSDTEGFAAAPHPTLEVIQDSGSLVIDNDEQIDTADTGIEASRSYTFTYDDVPDGVVPLRIRFIELVSVEIRVETADDSANISSHRLAFSVSDTSDDSVMADHGDGILLAKSLSTTAEGGFTTYAGLAPQALGPGYRATDTEFKLKILYTLALSDTFDENHIKIDIDNLKVRVYYET
jgi:hypothetical protein